MTEQLPLPSANVATDARLSSFSAIWNSFRGHDADFYPRITENGVVGSLSIPAMLQEMEKADAHWLKLKDDDTLENALDLAKQSLAEVKAQTEYQDQKATRLLTITTFLSALSGALFAQFQKTHPIDTIVNHPPWTMLLIGSVYLVFVAFVLLALSGALVTFHAVRTRFKYAPTQNAADQDRDPRSLLFYAPMIRSRPRSWIDGWVAAGRPRIRDDLKQRYFQHLVKETYMVAAKTADKLRYLEPAQSLLSNSLKCLFFWFVLLTLASLVPSTNPMTTSETTPRVSPPTLLRSSFFPNPAASPPPDLPSSRLPAEPVKVAAPPAATGPAESIRQRP